jgi:hypothetical protein
LFNRLGEQVQIKQHGLEHAVQLARANDQRQRQNRSKIENTLRQLRKKCCAAAR